MQFKTGQIYKPKEHIYETLDGGSESRLELGEWSNKTGYGRCIIDGNFFSGISEDNLVRDGELEE